MILEKIQELLRSLKETTRRWQEPFEHLVSLFECMKTILLEQIKNSSVTTIFTGVVLEVVAFVFIGVDVVLGKTFSESESEFSKFWRVTDFLTAGAISFNTSGWFSAKIVVRWDMISFLRNVLNYSNV